MAKVPVELVLESICVGCQYPEHQEAVLEMLGMPNPEEWLMLEITSIEYEEGGQQKFDTGIAVILPYEAAAGEQKRIGWIPTAEFTDVKEFMKVRDQVRAASMVSSDSGGRVWGHEEVLEINKVRWENEDEGILKSFDFTIKVKGLIKE